MGLGGTKRWRELLKLSYREEESKNKAGELFYGGIDPSRHHVITLGTGIPFLYSFAECYKHKKKLTNWGCNVSSI